MLQTAIATRELHADVLPEARQREHEEAHRHHQVLGDVALEDLIGEVEAALMEEELLEGRREDQIAHQFVVA
jgi:hypothetical protein